VKIHKIIGNPNSECEISRKETLIENYQRKMEKKSCLMIHNQSFTCTSQELKERGKDVTENQETTHQQRHASTKLGESTICSKVMVQTMDQKTIKKSIDVKKPSVPINENLSIITKAKMPSIDIAKSMDAMMVKK
jgi:hypothetical protein